ncbi:MAG: hypothetical protein IPI18_11690 [Saprospiraceae bacterium]|nr:hypothetical protein [Saprospiraceae bacterium]
MEDLFTHYPIQKSSYNPTSSGGTNCFDRFNGMFALALYDKLENKLILARDHAGIKPLYYSIQKRSNLLRIRDQSIQSAEARLERKIRLESVFSCIRAFARTDHYFGRCGPITQRNISRIQPGG